MLYDRLVLDLEQAEVAIGQRELAVVNDKLLHAQSIILEHHSALDPNAWDGADGLAQLYIWWNNELMQANVDKDAKPIRTCLEMVRQLCSAWHTAYDDMLSTNHIAASASAATA